VTDIVGVRLFAVSTVPMILTLKAARDFGKEKTGPIVPGAGKPAIAPI